MINLRMLAIASAILLALPVGMAAWDEYGSGTENDERTVVGSTLEAVATVTDVVLAELPREKIYDPASFREKENLVEGHTVFVTIDLEYRFNQTNGTIDIMALVECKANTRFTGPVYSLPFGLGEVTIPNRVEEAHAECRVHDEVIVSPDPFQNPPLARPTPTGRDVPFNAPNGQPAVAREYSYPVRIDMPDGTARYETFYAYGAPLMEPWVDHQGRLKSFFCPLPEDRLVEMGVSDYQVYHQKDAPHFR